MNVIRIRWQFGLCPCCGGELFEWPDGNGNYIAPDAVAEGVRFCGRCIANEHHIRPPEVLEEILRGIAEVP